MIMEEKVLEERQTEKREDFFIFFILAKEKKVGFLISV